MRKIRELTIKNFQSHKDTTINFQDYAIIHGATNSGKSAIIRAIKWCLYNEAPPEGAELTRFGEKETVVSIQFSDGRKITRKRTGKINEYLTCDENGQENTYTGFGRGPLQEILDFHGMYMANLFGEAQSVNIVDQQEPPFFLSEGPTARGHLISRLADTLVYEAALIMLKKDASEIKKNVENKRKKIDLLESEIQSLHFVDDFKKFIELARDDVDVIFKTSKMCDEIPEYVSRIKISMEQRNNSIAAASLLNDINQAQESINDVVFSNNKIGEIVGEIPFMRQAIKERNQRRDISDNLPDIENGLTAVEALEKELSRCFAIKTNFECIKSNAEQHQKYMAYTSLEAKILGIDKDIKCIEGNLSVIKDIASEVQKIKQCTYDFRDALNNYKTLNACINNLSDKYKNTLIEKGVCPTCFGVIDKERLTEVEI